MRIRIRCPVCQKYTATEDVTAEEWRCAACGHAIHAAGSDPSSGELTYCRVCGNQELYVQKDFPHWLGMTILVAACLASIITYAMHWIAITWAILIGSAIVDGLLYLWMGNVVVCYQCLSQYRGFPLRPDHAPFDLTIGEKYRQARLRRQQLENP